jgi:hypothetical protein
MIDCGVIDLEKMKKLYNGKIPEYIQKLITQTDNIYPNNQPNKLPESRDRIESTRIIQPNNDIYSNDDRIKYPNNKRIFGPNSGNKFGIDSGSKNIFGQHSGKVFGQYSGNNINPSSSAYLYFIEGHIPIEAIEKLLTEKPEIEGIAIPEMSSGSHGMSGFKLSPFKIHSIKNGQDQGIFMEI